MLNDARDTPTGRKVLYNILCSRRGKMMFLYNKLPLRVGRWYVSTSRIASLREWR